MLNFITYMYRLGVMAMFMAMFMLGVFASSAYAQDAAPNPAKGAIAEQAEQAELQNANAGQNPDAEQSSNDNTRDDVQAKLDAADKAQAEAYAALRAKYDAGEGADVPAQAEGADDAAPKSAKPSLIPKNAEEAKALGKKVSDKVLSWLKSPPFLAQVAAIIVIWWLLAPLIAKQLKRRVLFLRDPPKEGDKLLVIRKYVFDARDLLRPALNIGFLALFAVILKGALGQDWLVKLAQGLAVVFLLYSAIKQFAPNDLVKKIASWICIPLALLMVFGYFDDLLKGLDSLALGGGEDPFSLLTLIKLALFGSAFFWFGNFSNKKGQTAIRSQEALDIGIREIIAKFMQIVIFGAAAVMAMSAAGIGLSGLVVIFSALSLGIGLGLQPVAANFVSGMIILFDRSVRVGDFVSLDDGREGFVEAINMRSTTVETTNGKDIMVPNTTFIENSYENWTHKDPRQRYEVYFTVPYDTDVDKLEDIIIPVFEKHPLVLSEPEQPDLELREFAANGINFAVEFWCSGIDDGPNKFTSDLNFAVWRALKAAKIRMPLPQTEVRLLK